MSSLVVERVSTSPLVEVVGLGRVSPHVLDLVRGRLIELLRHPLSQLALTNVGKLVIAVTNDGLILLLPTTDLVNAVLSDRSSLLDLSNLGRTYYEHVSRSGMLIPLLEISELVPIVPIPEVASYIDYEGARRLIDELGLEESFCDRVSSCLRRWVGASNIVFRSSSYSSLSALLSEYLVNIGKGARILALGTEVGLVPFYLGEGRGATSRFKIIGSRGFKDYGSVLTWYLSRQYRRDIARALIDALISKLRLEVEPSKETTRRVIQVLSHLAEKYVPNSIVKVFGIPKILQEGELSVDLSSLWIEDLDALLRGIQVSDLGLETCENLSANPRILLFYLSFPPNEKTILPMLVVPSPEISLSDLFQMLKIISSSSKLRLFLSELEDELRGELGNLLIVRDKISEKLPLFIIRAVKGRQGEDIEARYNPRSGMLRLDLLRVRYLETALPSELTYWNNIPLCTLVPEVGEPKLILFKNVELGERGLTETSRRIMLDLVDRLTKILQSRPREKIIIVNLETGEIVPTMLIS